MQRLYQRTETTDVKMKERKYNVPSSMKHYTGMLNMSKIKLEPWNREKCDKLSEICNHIDRSYLSNMIPDPYTVKDADYWLNIAEKHDGADGIFRAIIYNDEYVGNISIEKKQDVYSKDAEIGYYIRREYCSRGIATEAVRLACKEAFEKLDIVRITSLVFSANNASKRVLEKNGFVYEGEMKNAVFKNETIYNLCIYGKYR